MIVDGAVYCGGVRSLESKDPAVLLDYARSEGGVTWIGLYQPTSEEFDAVAQAFLLDPLVVRGAVAGHLRSKLERHGETLFCVLRPARYHDDTETVEFGELHVFAGPNFVITARHGGMPKIADVRHALESRPDLLARGSIAILHAVIDRVVDDYEPVLVGVENDIDEIEDEVFSGAPSVSRRMYELIREVVQFQRASKPLVEMLQRLADDDAVSLDERRYVRDLGDRAARVGEQTTVFRQLLQSIHEVSLTLETRELSQAAHEQNIETRRLSEVTVAQNEEVKRLTEVSIAQTEEVKKISSWAAILFAPTLVAAVYGMNFKYMPELDWRLGYPLALVLMVASSVLLWGIFKRRHWI